MGSTDSEYGVDYELNEHNASRSCEICREPATRYLYREGDISTFRCDEHLPPANGSEDQDDA